MRDCGQGGGGRGAPIASLSEIGRVLEETARMVRHHAAEAGEAQRFPSAPADPAMAVRAILAARRLRLEHLGAVAAGPAWAMVLELYLARLEGRRLCRARLAVAAGVPQTTALAVAARLLDEGVVTREADPGDRRLVMVALSDEAAERVRAYIGAAATGLAPWVA